MANRLPTPNMPEPLKEANLSDRFYSGAAESHSHLTNHFNAEVRAARAALPPQAGPNRAQAGQDLAAMIARGPTAAGNGRYGHALLPISNAISGAIPPKALKIIKRYLRRECRKPVGMSARECFDKLMCINQSEIPRLPTNRAGPTVNMFTGDELTDILLYATPKSWEKEMDRQGFEPLENSLASALTMMERIEAAEAPSAKISKADKPKKAKKAPSHSKPKGGKYCALHGKGSHSTDECKALKPKIQEGNWNGKAKVSKFKANKELPAFIKKPIKDGAGKKLAGYKKRSHAEANAVGANGDLQDVDFGNLNIDEIDA